MELHKQQQKPIIQQLEQNSMAENILQKHDYEKSKMEEIVQEENSKKEMKKLMKLVFKYENEKFQLEEELNRKVDRIKEEMQVNYDINIKLKNEISNKIKELKYEKKLIQEYNNEIKNESEEMNMLAGDHDKKIHSLELKNEQEKYLTVTLNTLSDQKNRNVAKISIIPLKKK